MLFTAPITSEPFIGNTLPQPDAGAGTGAPKSDEFDFVNYLVGLQAEMMMNPDTAILQDALKVASLNGEAVEGVQSQDAALLSLFDKGSREGHLLVPEMMAPTDVSTPEILAQEAAPEEVGESLSSWKTQLALAHPEMDGAETAQAEEGVSVDLSKATKELSSAELGEVAERTMAVQKYQQMQGTLRAHQVTASESATKTMEVVESGAPMVKALLTEQPEALGETDSKPAFSLGQPLNLQSAVTEISSPAPTERPASIPELFDKVEGMVQRGGGKMTVNLNPPELGQVAIEVATRGNQVEVKMASQGDAARTLLEGGLGELRNSLQSQDLVVSKLEVATSRDFGMASEWEFQHPSDLAEQNSQQSDDTREQSKDPDFETQSAEIQTDVASVGHINTLTRSSLAAPSLAGRVDIRI